MKLFFIIVNIQILFIISFGLQKIPVYVGMSYHYIYADPNYQYGYDPGIKYPIFNFNYANRITLSNRKYLIPDQTYSSLLNSCSLLPKISTYKGTMSYQNQIKQQINISSVFNTISNFSFMKSKSIIQIQEATYLNKTVVYFKYQCPIYQLTFNKSNQPSLSKYFINGVLNAYKTGKWSYFFNKFGTHYINSVQMGSKTINKLDINQTIASKIQNLDININLSIKQFFQSYYNVSSFNFNDYLINKQYVQSLLRQKKQITFGVRFPQTRNITQWQALRQKNQVPIYYKIQLLSQLFRFIPNFQFNSTDSLQNQCNKINCVQLTPDFPNKTVLPLNFIQLNDQTNPYYGAGAIPFNATFKSSTIQLRKIYTYSGYHQNIDSNFMYSMDGIKLLFRIIAIDSDTLNYWEVSIGQYISKVYFSGSGLLTGLDFTTNKGSISPHLGEYDAFIVLRQLPQNYRIVGVYGVLNWSIETIGFIAAHSLNQN